MATNRQPFGGIGVAVPLCACEVVSRKERPMVLNNTDKISNLQWQIKIDDLNDKRRSYAYYGGSLIEVLLDGEPHDFININNVGKGSMSVSSMADLLEVINAWLEGDYYVGSSDHSY
jgi:hypothetical protein|tara:strand:- start:717 stop:1067 length:351 start_codon:yes stop_codon:yes gene_type:complete